MSISSRTVTSADLLHHGWSDARAARGSGKSTALSHVETLPGALSPNAGLVTIIDGSPSTLSWLGGVRGMRTSPLGTDRFGQTGDLPDLYRTYRLDAEAIVGAIESPAVWEAYEADRAETRTAEGGPTHFQGKSFDSDGKERFTAPSLVLTAGGGASLEAGGFQPVEAYDVCIANLDRTLERRAPAEDPLEALAAFDVALATREIAAVMAKGMDPRDDEGVERALITAAAEGRVTREAVGDGALWRLA